MIPISNVAVVASVVNHNAELVVGMVCAVNEEFFYML